MIYLVMDNKKLIDTTVFPSKTRTVCAMNASDEYGGAHKYEFLNSDGFANGEAQYHPTTQSITFVHKDPETGRMTPGLQSEQLVIALIDRTQKLDAKYPSPQSGKMIQGLQMYLDACRERIEDRMSRGVMGELKK